MRDSENVQIEKVGLQIFTASMKRMDYIIIVRRFCKFLSATHNSSLEGATKLRVVPFCSS